MNGILHVCAHGRSDGAKKSGLWDEADFARMVFSQLERIFACVFLLAAVAMQVVCRSLHLPSVSIVKPKRLLYIAIDGPAPRAKLNQQRQRRFRVAREAKLSQSRKEELGSLSGELSACPPPFSLVTHLREILRLGRQRCAEQCRCV